LSGSKRVGNQTLVFPSRPAVRAGAAVVGPKEGDGPLGQYFDVVKGDTLLGEPSWERAEVRMLGEAAELAVYKAGMKPGDVHALLAGDLLNQITTSSFAARGLPAPYLGLYSACATFSQALALGAVLVDGGFAAAVVAAASSHHDTAERQFRYPTEFGNQRTPAAQWTVCGAGAAVVATGSGPWITHATPGRVVDMGGQDVNDMGSAMAPAAADTIWQHLMDTGRKPDYYDLIITGDLGRLGRKLCSELLQRRGLEVGKQLADCGCLIYDPTPEVRCGGSGCGCSAATFSTYLLTELGAGRLNRILLVSTGSLHSPGTAQQGESMPGVAHAVAVENPHTEGAG
jgi:stage V sporulation protein AD